MKRSTAAWSAAYRSNMVRNGVPTPVSHSSSDGAVASHLANAYRIDPRISPIESINVPSRSKRIAAGREAPSDRGVGEIAIRPKLPRVNLDALSNTACYKKD